MRRSDVPMSLRVGIPLRPAKPGRKGGDVDSAETPQGTRWIASSTQSRLPPSWKRVLGGRTTVNAGRNVAERRQQVNRPSDRAPRFVFIVVADAFGIAEGSNRGIGTLILSLTNLGSNMDLARAVPASTMSPWRPERALTLCLANADLRKNRRRIGRGAVRSHEPRLRTLERTPVHHAAQDRLRSAQPS